MILGVEIAIISGIVIGSSGIFYKLYANRRRRKEIALIDLSRDLPVKTSDHLMYEDL